MVKSEANVPLTNIPSFYFSDPLSHSVAHFRGHQQRFNSSGNLYTRDLNMTQDEQSYYTHHVDHNFGNNFTQNLIATPNVLKRANDSSFNSSGLNHLGTFTDNNNNKTSNDHVSHPPPHIQMSPLNLPLNFANSNLIAPNITYVEPIYGSVDTNKSISVSRVSDRANVGSNLDSVGHLIDQLPSVSMHLISNLTISDDSGTSTLYNNSTQSNERLETQFDSSMQSNDINLTSTANSVNNGTSGGFNDHFHWTNQYISPTLTSTLFNQSYGINDSSSSYFTKDNGNISAHEDSFFSTPTENSQKQGEISMVDSLLNQLGSSNTCISNSSSNGNLFQNTHNFSSSAISMPHAYESNYSVSTNSDNFGGSGVISNVFDVGIDLSIGNSNNSNSTKNNVAPISSSNIVTINGVRNGDRNIRSSTPVNFSANDANNINQSDNLAFESGTTISGQLLDITTGSTTDLSIFSSSHDGREDINKPSWASIASQPAKLAVKPKSASNINNVKNIEIWNDKTNGNSIFNSSNQIGSNHSINKCSVDSSSVLKSWPSSSQQGKRTVIKNSVNGNNSSTSTVSNGNTSLTCTTAYPYLRQQGMIKNLSPINHYRQTIGNTALAVNDGEDMNDLNCSRPTNLWSYNGLRVVNVAPSCPKSTLVSLFSKFGRIKNIERINTSKASEHSIWVYYDNPRSPVEAAAKLLGEVIDNVSLDGQPLRIHFAPTDDQKDLKFSRPKQPPDNKGECYYWRTTNCFSREQCPLLHIPANKNIDAQIWMKMNKEQPMAVTPTKSR